MERVNGREMEREEKERKYDGEGREIGEERESESMFR